MFRLLIDDPALAERVKGGGPELLSLCQQQVGAFDRYLRNSGDKLYAGGLHPYEQSVCVGLLYQMYRGHLPDVESTPPPDDLPEG